MGGSLGGDDSPADGDGAERPPVLSPAAATGPKRVAEQLRKYIEPFDNVDVELEVYDRTFASFHLRHAKRRYQLTVIAEEQVLKLPQVAVPGGVAGAESAVLARRWFEDVWNGRQLHLVDEMVAPECVGHHPDRVTHGRDEWKRMQLAFLSAFPNMGVVVEAVVADENQAVVRWRFQGTHTGDGLGVKATGRRIDVPGTTWFRFEGGKLVEGWDNWDAGTFFADLSKQT